MHLWSQIINYVTYMNKRSKIFLYTISVFVTVVVFAAGHTADAVTVNTITEPKTCVWERIKKICTYTNTKTSVEVCSSCSCPAGTYYHSDKVKDSCTGENRCGNSGVWAGKTYPIPGEYTCTYISGATYGACTGSYISAFQYVTKYTYSTVPGKTCTDKVFGPKACTIPRPPTPVNGACGNAAGDYEATASVWRSPVCSAGDASPVTPWTFLAQGATKTWTCRGENGGSDASCSAYRKKAIVDGACGNGAGEYAADAQAWRAPVCKTGIVNPATPWTFLAPGETKTWTCKGENGGKDSSCTANRLVPPPPVIGECGDASGEYAADAQTWRSPVCKSGTPNPATPWSFLAPGETRSWSCDGAYGGAGASCTAHRLVPPCACGTTPLFSEFSPTENLCVTGNLQGSVIGENKWKWKCGGTTCAGELECARECARADIKAPSSVYLKENDTKIKVGVKIDAEDGSISSGKCTISLNGGSSQDVSYDKNSGATNEVEFDYPNSTSVEIEAACELKGQCGGVINFSDEKTFLISATKNVTSMCAEKTCNAQNRCQSIPKSGVSSASACHSSCSSDSDCNAGRMIETRPKLNLINNV